LFCSASLASCLVLPFGFNLLLLLFSLPSCSAWAFNSSLASVLLLSQLFLRLYSNACFLASSFASLFCSSCSAFNLIFLLWQALLFFLSPQSDFSSFSVSSSLLSLIQQAKQQMLLMLLAMILLLIAKRFESSFSILLI
jgi:hypothetical protein